MKGAEETRAKEQSPIRLHNARLVSSRDNSSGAFKLSLQRPCTCKAYSDWSMHLGGAQVAKPLVCKLPYEAYPDSRCTSVAPRWQSRWYASSPTRVDAPRLQNRRYAPLRGVMVHVPRLPALHVEGLTKNLSTFGRSTRDNSGRVLKLSPNSRFHLCGDTLSSPHRAVPTITLCCCRRHHWASSTGLLQFVLGYGKPRPGDATATWGAASTWMGTLEARMPLLKCNGHRASTEPLFVRSAKLNVWVPWNPLASYGLDR